MDWKLAIEKNQAGLVAIVVRLFMLAKWAPGLTKPETLSRQTCLKLHRILRTAEAAMRRLIVLFMRVHTIKAQASMSLHRELPDFTALKPATEKPPRFNLIDPRKPLRIGWLDDEAGELQVGNGYTCETETQSLDGPPIKPARLLIRLAALDHALTTLPAQARRLARLIKRRETAPPGPGRIGPIRPGKPPGHRDRPVEEADYVLRECHGLVRDFAAIPP